MTGCCLDLGSVTLFAAGRKVNSPLHGLPTPRRWFSAFGPSQMVIVVALLLLGLFLYATVQTAAQSHRLRIQERELRAEIATLQSQRAELDGLSRYLASDEYIEAFARDRFGLAYPGEIVVEVDAAEPLTTVRAPGERWWEALFTD